MGLGEVQKETKFLLNIRTLGLKHSAKQKDMQASPESLPWRSKGVQFPTERNSHLPR